MTPDDRPLRALLASIGYPDPDTVRSERMLWPASTRIRTSRTCSASSRKVAVSSPEIRQILHTVYTEHLQLPPEWTPGQRQEFLETEAAKISYQIAELAVEMSAQAVTDWTSRHGEHPDYLTKVGLINSATASAKEIVLNQELYEMIPEPQDSTSTDQIAPEPILDRSQVPWDQRWTRTQYRSDPSEQIEALAARMWPDPDFSAVFRIKAGYLLTARDEDQLPQPSRPGDPLAAELAQMVFSDLRRDGLPDR
jgi:hypothetical protein